MRVWQKKKKPSYATKFGEMSAVADIACFSARAGNVANFSAQDRWICQTVERITDSKVEVQTMQVDVKEESR
jgi:hypothetical protein